MNVFMNNILVWALIATGLVLVGYAFAKGTNKTTFLWQGVITGVLAVIVGIVCVYFVQTEEKQVRATIYAIAEAAERNDPDAVIALLSRDAQKTTNPTGVKGIVKWAFKLATVEKTKVTNFKILELNLATSPPRAKVSLRASAQGKSQGTDAYPFFTIVEFPMIELRKEQDGVWRVTDNIEYLTPQYL